MATISEAITEGAARLSAAQIIEERRTATVLLADLLDVDRAYLLARSNEQIEEASFQKYLQWIERRCSGEPLQYITGHQEFYKLDFIVTPDVLIPRPETEFLVERVIELARGLTRSPRPLLIVDVGTGSGCIAIALAANISYSNMIAIDISASALKVALGNAERNAVAARVEFLEGDLLAPLAERGLNEQVDFIVSNPPYVDEASLELVQREVRDWEPRLALFGGQDGLDNYRRLLTGAPRYLKPGGYLALEIGYNQLEAIQAMIEKSSLELIDVTNDLQGIPRTLTLRKP